MIRTAVACVALTWAVLSAVGHGQGPQLQPTRVGQELQAERWRVYASLRFSLSNARNCSISF
jgi:hypothetical protein